MTRRLALSLCVVGALAACSGERDPVAGLVLSPLRNLIGGGQAPPDARRLLSRDLIATAERPFILVGQLDADAWFSALAAGANRGHVSYRAGDGTGVILADGILTGTRGLGFDLHTAAVDGARARIGGDGTGTTRRVHRIIDGNDRIVARRYLCSWQRAGSQTLEFYGIAYATRRVVETCGTGEAQFVNEYWIGGDGIVRQSRQHVSDEVGTIEIRQLVP